MSIVTHRIYVGRIPPQMSRDDLRELFEKYGKLQNIEMKRNGYAFVEFEDDRDAEDAVYHLKGYNEYHLNIDWSKKKEGTTSTCYVCGKSGHWAKYCPDNIEKGLDVKSGKCFNCGEVGHLAKFCTYKRNNNNRDSRRSRSPYHYSPSTYYYRGRSHSRSASPYYSRDRSPLPYIPRSRSRSFDSYERNNREDYRRLSRSHSRSRSHDRSHNRSRSRSLSGRPRSRSISYRRRSRSYSYNSRERSIERFRRFRSRSRSISRSISRNRGRFRSRTRSRSRSRERSGSRLRNRFRDRSLSRHDPVNYNRGYSKSPSPHSWSPTRPPPHLPPPPSKWSPSLSHSKWSSPPPQPPQYHSEWSLTH